MHRLLVKNLEWLRQNHVETSQNRDDLDQLYHFMLTQPPMNVFVEIGVWQGGTLLLLSQFVHAKGLVIGIDKYNSAVRHDERNKQRSALVMKRMHEIRELNVMLVQSYSLAAVPQVQTLLGGRKIDYLHIDGDHTYTAVQADFAAYLPLMSPTGLVQFHDINTEGKVLGSQPSPDDHKGGVPQLWQEMKAKYPKHFEFVNNTQNPAMTGIGLIQL
jgi:cephalosporin hydroxylase